MNPLDRNKIQAEALVEGWENLNLIKCNLSQIKTNSGMIHTSRCPKRMALYDLMLTLLGFSNGFLFYGVVGLAPEAASVALQCDYPAAIHHELYLSVTEESQGQGGGC